MQNLTPAENIFNNIKSFFERSLSNRKWDWQAAALVVALVQISAARLVITEWAPFLYFIQTIGFFGTILGLALGYSSFERKGVMRFTFWYALFIIPAHLLNATERTDLLWQDLLALASRFFASLAQFLRDQPTYDPLFFVALVCIGYWVISVWSSYQLVRNRNFLPAVLPAGIAMLIVQLFDPARSIRVWGLAIYILISMLLLGRLFFLENQETWKKSRVLVTTDALREIASSTLITAIVVVVFAWSLPSLIANIGPAADAWEKFSRPFLDRFSTAVTALDSPYGSSGTTGDFYGGELSLGQRAATGDAPVFYVQMEESEVIPPRMYWRGRVFNVYVNGRWTASPTLSKEFSPVTDELQSVNDVNRTEFKFTFTNLFAEQNLIYAPSETLWVGRASRILTISPTSPQPDVAAWLAETSLVNGSRYEVHASIANPSIEELRAAETEYPNWVTDEYLQIPENIEPQLRVLAEEITAPYETAYDKTAAITAYLRDEIAYEIELTQEAPENIDPVLWVLFDYKKGFCMYSASAEVLMLRAIGIPARMSVGFAEGVFNEQADQYEVVRQNSHAWPEVYFPNIGWVEFEPTGNQFPLERPITRDDGTVLDEQDIEEATATEVPQTDLPEDAPVDAQDIVLNHSHTFVKDSSLPARQSMPLWQRFVIFLVAAMLLTAGVLLARHYSLAQRLPAYLAEKYTRNGANSKSWLSRWARWAKLQPIEKTFHTINLSLYWLGHPQPGYKTPAERANVLINILPLAKDAIQELTLQYQTALFTNHSANLKSAYRASRKIMIETIRNRVFKKQDYQK